MRTLRNLSCERCLCPFNQCRPGETKRAGELHETSTLQVFFGREIRDGSTLTPGIWYPDLFGNSGSESRDPFLFSNDPDLKENPGPFRDPGSGYYLGRRLEV